VTLLTAVSRPNVRVGSVSSMFTGDPFADGCEQLTRLRAVAAGQAGDRLAIIYR
jgi:hypothetical protein